MTKEIKRDRINELAGVAELADAPDLGSGVPDVKVQVLSPVPRKKPLLSTKTREVSSIIIELVVFLHYNYFRKASELRGIQWTN